MKKLLLSIFLFFLLFSCSKNSNLKGITKEIKNVLVEVSSISKDSTISGTGFIVDSHGLIVTSNSLLLENSKISIKLGNNLVYKHDEIGVIYRDLIQDLAILFIYNARNLPYVKIQNNINHIGTAYIFGYPKGELIIKETSGIDNNEEIFMQYSYIPLNLSLDNKFLGGPIVNQKGEVIGVSSLRKKNKSSLVVPIRYAQSILKDLDNMSFWKNSTVLNGIKRGDLIFNDPFFTDNNHWINLGGNWRLTGAGYIAQISPVEYPFQNLDEAILISSYEFDNFILEVNIKSIARFDGYTNNDFGVIFGFANKYNYFLFNTYSKDRDYPDIPLCYQDKGGLWAVEAGEWHFLASSCLFQPFQNQRWYSFKLVVNNGNVKGFIDNILAFNYKLETNCQGRIGFRTVNSHVWFSNLRIYALQEATI